jgi:hypothetical protein
MISDQLKQLALAREKVAALEATIAAERRRELSRLPGRYGFENASDFIQAVRAAGETRRGRPASPGSKQRRKRAVITDDTRAEVKKLVKAGKTGNEIAKAVGISLPSVQNVKKALGLVEARK